MTVYIIGPISGRVDANKPAFYVARAYASRLWPDAEVIIPHDLYEPYGEALKCPALCWCEAMVRCLPVARAADVVLALPDWRQSVGARVEVRERRGVFLEFNGRQA